jgi:hypothetical protein
MARRLEPSLGIPRLPAVPVAAAIAPHLDAFWFAWQAYKPDTLVYGVDA